ncbi:MAG TPA: PPOX class F420-dependent oxidoreductase [Gaiellaceae bacterium]|nr:PPOX class F420-dependent oxidoreductase [Gaiellaceae bacterium]
MKRLTRAQRAFLENPYIGIATTLRPDGSPHSTPVWVDVDEDGGVSFNTAWPRAKPRHLRADARVSLVVVDPGDELRWLGITGTATLTEEGANDQIDRLARKYRGHDRYMSHREGETRVTVRISPTFVESRGL